MLKFLRQKHIAKAIFWGTLILILPAFVLWGSGNLSGGKDKGPTFVGFINNKKVSFEDLSKSLMSIRSQIILNYFNQPELLNTLLRSKPFLAKLAWDRLIMVSELKKYNIKVSDKDLIGQISSHPIFNRSGKFDDKVYNYVLKYNLGSSARAFEEMIREGISIQRMNDIITKDVKITDDDIRDEYIRDKGRFKIKYVIFSLKDFEDKVKIEDAAIKEYYEKHKTEIMVKPTLDDGKTPPRQATFDEAVPKIKAFLAENETRTIAFKQADEMYKKIKDSMEKEKIGFPEAAAKLGLKVSETLFFSKSDKLEGIGEASMLAAITAKLDPNQVPEPVSVESGIMIFSRSDTEKIDEEPFKKDKDEYSKKALELKKNRFLEGWLRKLEDSAKLNIDLKDYDKYFQ